MVGKFKTEQNFSQFCFYTPGLQSNVIARVVSWPDPFIKIYLVPVNEIRIGSGTFYNIFTFYVDKQHAD